MDDRNLLHSGNPNPAGQLTTLPGELSRRGFLRGSALVGGGIVAATVAACAPSGSPLGMVNALIIE